MNSYDKIKTIINRKLISENCQLWKQAFEFAISKHIWLRKDKKTPEFKHQLDICKYLFTLNIPDNEIEKYIIVALLHDIREDYGVEDEEIRNLYWNDIADAVELLTKKFKGNVKDLNKYFSDISTNKYACIVKWADRINNLQTMKWVFSYSKQEQYTNEAKNKFLKMVKNWRKNFPDLADAFVNIEIVLKTQIELLEDIILLNKKD